MKNVTITGLQQAQAANLRHVAAMTPAGAFGRCIQYATVAAQRYAVTITHVDTGALRAAHRVKVTGLHGEVYLDPTGYAPTGKRPSVYGPHEHARGGEHAFYARTVAEYGDQAAHAGAVVFSAELR